MQATADLDRAAKQFAMAAMLLLIAALGFVIWPATRSDIIKPGELSTPHAQILAGTLDSDRCAACHNGMVTPASHHVTQSDRCLDCHHNTMPRETAMLAHNLPADVRRDIRLASNEKVSGATTWYDSPLNRFKPSQWKTSRWKPGPGVDVDNVACSACHREHRGKGGDLVSMSNDQCQTCHNQRFDDFATSHPSWDGWPYGRGGSIAFDHASHLNKHYPSTPIDGQTMTFDCNACHVRDAAGELSRSASYEATCMACHDAALRIESAAGLELVTLPSLSRSAAERIEGWPEAAIGFFDGRIAGLADLLLRTDEDVSVAMRKLPRRDFALVEQQNAADVDAAVRVAAGHRELLELIGGRGQSAIADRIAKSDLSAGPLNVFLSSLSPQLIDQARRKWFSGGVAMQATTSKAVLEDDLLGDDLLAGDLLGSGDHLLSEDPLAMEIESPSDMVVDKRFDADAMIPAGGWYRDDVTMSIRYRGGGHDDVVVKAVVELLAQLPPDDPARDRLMESKAIAACIDCHPGTLDANGWRSDPLVGAGGFTKFSHGPHLNIAGMSDCRHCHQVADVSPTVSLTSHPEFHPMTVATCGSCHQAEAAGDACVKCHRYHVQRP